VARGEGLHRGDRPWARCCLTRKRRRSRVHRAFCIAQRTHPAPATRRRCSTPANSRCPGKLDECQQLPLPDEPDERLVDAAPSPDRLRDEREHSNADPDVAAADSGVLNTTVTTRATAQLAGRYPNTFPEAAEHVLAAELRASGPLDADADADARMRRFRASGGVGCTDARGAALHARRATPSAHRRRQCVAQAESAWFNSLGSMAEWSVRLKRQPSGAFGARQPPGVVKTLYSHVDINLKIVADDRSNGWLPPTHVDPCDVPLHDGEPLAALLRRVDYLWNCCNFLSARWVSARCEGDKPTGLYALHVPARRPLRPRSDRSGPPLGRYAAAGILPARYTPLRFAAAVDAAVVPGCVLGRALSNDRLARARRCAAASQGDKAGPRSLETFIGLRCQLEYQ
jgi:hypothetical protein